jgi:hypothetical protein
MYPNELGSLGRTIQSQVDCDNPNYEIFPKSKEVICEETILGKQYD